MEKTIDLRGVAPTSYSPGDRIIGCLEELGWVGIRVIQIGNATYESINTIADSVHNGRVTRNVIGPQ